MRSALGIPNNKRMGTSDPAKGMEHPDPPNNLHKRMGTVNPAKGTEYPDHLHKRTGMPDPAKGTFHPSKEIIEMGKKFVAVDFGTGTALALHGPDGPMPRPKLPPVPGGAATSDGFVRTLPILLEKYNVVCESATVGSSGVEPEEIEKIVNDAPHDLYVISGRAVKNFRNDAQRGYLGAPREWRKGARYAKGRAAERIKIEPQEDVHAEDAEIIWILATEFPERLRKWSLNPDRFHRHHTSVRPHDKRNYRGPVPDAFMARLPLFEQLSPQVQDVFGIGKGRNRGYSRAKAMPFAMALDEDGAETREGYEKIIGLSEHGYPSFYRRTTVALMQCIAKEMAGTTRINEVSPQTRKQAWRKLRRHLRELHYMMMARSVP